MRSCAGPRSFAPLRMTGEAAGLRMTGEAAALRMTRRALQIEVAKVLWTKLLEIGLQLFGRQPLSFCRRETPFAGLHTFGFIRIAEELLGGKDGRLHAQRDGDGVGGARVDDL